MFNRVKWGVLGVANIAVKKVIPAMQQGEWCEVSAIASRDLTKARTAASQLNIPKAYGSYDELLNDPEIEAIYNPLPNNLHVEWTTKAAQAGKHVLCEKPISMSVAEALPLLDIKDVKIEEAFMIRTNPQWVKVLDLINEGRVGKVRSVVGYFSYNNRDLSNIRNIRETGGGGLMDIGCYLIFTSRLIFGAEPTKVVSLVEYEAETQTDVLTSALLDFPSGHAIMTCSTRVTPYQRVHVIGDKGRIEVEIPFNAPPDKPNRVFVDDETLEFPIVDQYTIQGDLFSQAIRENKDVALSLEDSIRNMAVIEAIFRSTETKQWESPLRLCG